MCRSSSMAEEHSSKAASLFAFWPIELQMTEISVDF